MKTVQPDSVFQVDRLQVRVYKSRMEMGEAAARDTARRVQAFAEAKDTIRMVFAAAPSQDEFLETFISQPGIDWSRIVAFHMDEYLGLPANAPQGFGRYLKDRLFDRVGFARVETIDPMPSDECGECRRYASLLGEAPIDLVCMGIGENGHIAFNDPPVANFDDPETVKIVALEERCRMQQVHDGCFSRIQDVPERALTLTVPALVSAAALSIVVPGSTKAEAVFDTLNGPIDTACPASILRRHADAVLYLDRDSAARL